MILRGLMNLFSEDELLVFCGNPERVTKVFGMESYRFFPGGLRSGLQQVSSAEARQILKQSQKALNSAEKILIGGGGILVDRHLKAVSLWWAQLRVIQKSQKPYAFIANSFELKRTWCRRLFKPFLKAAESISVRDSHSLQFIENLGLKATQVEDLAYQAKLPPYTKTPQKILGLALCRWGWKKSSLEALKPFLQSKIDEGYQLQAMAFQSQGDDDRDFYEKLGFDIPVLTDWEEIVSALANCEVLLGMRLHSLILADRLKIPAFALAYQAKVSYFMEDQGRSELVLSMDAVDEQNLQDLFLKAVAGDRK